MFSIYLKHCQNMPASYIYLILPATAQQKVRSFNSKSIHIVRNDETAQAVVIKDLCYVSIYQPMEIQIDGLRPITLSEPRTYIIHTKKGEFAAASPFIIADK